jgi:hypothetical protein
MSLLQLMHLTKQAMYEQDMMEKEARKLPKVIPRPQGPMTWGPKTSAPMDFADIYKSPVPKYNIMGRGGNNYDFQNSYWVGGGRFYDNVDPKNSNLGNMFDRQFGRADDFKIEGRNTMKDWYQDPPIQSFYGKTKKDALVDLANRRYNKYNFANALADPKNTFLNIKNSPQYGLGPQAPPSNIKPLTSGQKKLLGAGSVGGVGAGAYGGYAASKKINK